MHSAIETQTLLDDWRSQLRTHAERAELHIQSWSEHVVCVVYLSPQMGKHCVVNGLQSQKFCVPHSVWLVIFLHSLRH